MADLQAYKERVDRLVLDGHLTSAEAFILTSVRGEAIKLKAKDGAPVREPVCQTCGERSTIIGNAQRFRCKCSPEVERSVADGVRG